MSITESTDAWLALKADTHRQFGAFGWPLLVKGVLTQRIFRVIVTMRLCQMCAHSCNGVFRLLFLPVLQILHRIAAYIASVEMSWRTAIGPGVAIVHGWGLVVNIHAVIGSNVTIFHGVTLGQRDRISSDGLRTFECPILEDNVWVGPHAIIVGGVTIGNGSRIAGGAFVTENIPPRSIVVGNPAVIVKSDCSPDVMNPAPITDYADKLRRDN